MKDQIKKIALFAVGDKGWIGGIQYIINIISALNNSGKKIHITLFKRNTQKFDHIKKFTNINIDILNLKAELAKLPLHIKLKSLLLRKIFKKNNPIIDYYLKINNYVFAYPILTSNIFKVISYSWIADFQYYYYPEGANPAITKQAFNTISLIANNAKKIILSSKHCENDLHKLFPSTKHKTFVLPFAVYIDSDNFKINDFNSLIEIYQIPYKYIMISNIWAPTKNHEVVFKALNILTNNGLDVPLICTGSIVDYAIEGYGNQILEMLFKYKIRHLVHILGLIPRKDQINLFRMAKIIIQPSISEGWSTCVEEAKSLNKFILLSNIEVHKEQKIVNGEYFDPLDEYKLADLIETHWLQRQDIVYPNLIEEKNSLDKYKNENVKKFSSKLLSLIGYAEDKKKSEKNI